MSPGINSSCSEYLADENKEEDEDEDQDEDEYFVKTDDGSGQSNRLGLDFPDQRLVEDNGVSSEQKRGPRKKTGPRAKTAREWFSKRNESTNGPAIGVQDSKRKQPNGGLQYHDTISRKRPKKSRGASIRKVGRLEKTSKTTFEAMFEGLRNNNPMESRIALGDLPEVDPITASTKISQFQQIMNNLPENVDKRAVGSDKNKLREATRSFGYGNCVAKDGKWLVKGMKTALHAHQVIASSWMLNREFSRDAPWGGILADEMGMGKTLETLGCIVSNQPTGGPDEVYHKATLIIAPATAIKQWITEIKKHTEISGILHFKQSQELPKEAWANMDIIIASYHEIARQYPSKNIQTQLRNGEGSIEEKQERFNELLGPLFEIPFWRIVLGEAHQIKNDKSQMSIACQRLQGQYRWAISGTPITNSVDELNPYLRFLKADWNGNLEDFQYLFGNLADDNATTRLAGILSTIMLRRTTKDSFMGQPLYTIPLCHPEVKRVQLSKEERIIYSTVETRYRSILNKLLKKGGQGKFRDREIYLIYLLRLRQGAAHPLLLEPTLKRTLHESDIRHIKAGLAQLAKVGGQRPAYEPIRAWCADVATEIEGGHEKGLTSSQIALKVSKFGYEFNMDKQIDLALASKSEDVCRICFQEPAMPQQAECGHTFCKECIEEHKIHEYKDGRASPLCPECNKPLGVLNPLEETESEGSELGSSNFSPFGSQSFAPGGYEEMGSFYQNYSDANYNTTSMPLGKDKRRLGNDFFDVQPKLKKSMSKFLLICDQAYPEPVVPSSKTIAAKEAVLKWQAEAPDDKIIIFTEFKMVGAIVGRMLQAENVPFLYFFGDMSQKEKNNALRGFEERKEVKVLIASLKCGGVALNLTFANRVILLDLWWNVSVELQAFARVFRMGQMKETHFLRIVSQDTIDNRIEYMQADKLHDISRVLEGRTSSRQKLTIEKAASLLGQVKKNEDGSLEIVADYTA